MATDWLTVQNEYLQTKISLRALATRHGIGYGALQRRAAQEGWVALRHAGQSLPDPTPKPQMTRSEPTLPRTPSAERAPARKRKQPSIATETPEATRTPPAPAAQADPPAPEQIDRMAQLKAIGDQLTAQLARATDELDRQVLKHKSKTREVVYDGMDSRGKPVEETVEEKYQLEVVRVPVSCAGLQKLSATLKNLREATRADQTRDDGVERVTELMRRLDDEASREEE